MRKWLPAVIAAVFVLVIAGHQFNGAAARGPNIDGAIAVQDRHTPGLLRIGGVVGSGVGLDASGQPVIRVYVASPSVVGVPAALEGVPVETVVTGQIVAQCRQSECPRPVPIGVSTGHPDITAGTLGARVTNGTNVFALSNNHVYADQNDASIGDSALQPGAYDGGTDPADKIGALHDFEPINFSGGNNQLDAAIAITSTSMVGTSTLPDGYGTPSSSHISCNSNCGNLLNLNVQKYGRTTGLTAGTINEVNVTVNVCYEGFAIFCTKLATFVDQITILDNDGKDNSNSFSAGGDSGSLIVSQSGNQPVGLLFAGSSARTIANRIDLVLNRFGVTVDDSGAGDPPPTSTHTPTPTATDTPSDAEPTSTFTPTATSTPSSGISLSVVAYKVRGLQKADLSWSGATSTNVDIYRANGTGSLSLLVTTENDGFHTDNINNRGGGSYTYRLCEAGTSTCSDDVTINF